MVIIDFKANLRAVVVGTVHGVFVSWLGDGRDGLWARMGLFKNLPLVLTLGVSYEHYSDTLVASTFGRGVYVIRNGMLCE
jgi:hypothetical protein